MTTIDPVRLRARDGAELVNVVPYLLGFHPEESLVAIWLAGGRVRLTARFDLPDRLAAAELARECARLSDRQAADSLLLIGYAADRELAVEVTGAVAAELGGLPLAEVLCVSGGRFWSLTCDGPCCPAEGRPLDGGARIAAEAVYAGLTAQPSRAALQAAVAGPPGAEHARLEQRAALLDTRGHGGRRELLRLLRAAASDAGPSEDQALRLALLVRDVDLRDLAWSRIEPERPEPHLSAWRAVVVRVPPSVAVAPLCLLGVASWIAGGGALLNLCADRALALDPGYSMAGLLRELSERAVPPDLWRLVRTASGTPSGRRAGGGGAPGPPTRL